MKTHVSALILALAAATAVQAQPPVPGLPARPLSADKGLPAPPPPARELVPVKEFTGKVVKLVANDDFVYDGFYLLSGSDSLLVRFPAHLGSQVMAGIKTGSAATVSGTADPLPRGGQAIRMISATSNGRTVRDTSAAAPLPAPASGTFVNGNGKITLLQTDPEGRLKGVVVNNRTILRFGPGVTEQLAALARSGADIAFTGMRKPDRQGEVAAGTYTVIRCKTVTLNGQQYLVQ